jgi:hypothetical protein
VPGWIGQDVSGLPTSANRHGGAGRNRPSGRPKPDGVSGRLHLVGRLLRELPRNRRGEVDVEQVM